MTLNILYFLFYQRYSCLFWADSPHRSLNEKGKALTNLKLTTKKLSDSAITFEMMRGIEFDFQDDKMKYGYWNGKVGEGSEVKKKILVSTVKVCSGKL
jgi:hypothetical protein